MYTMYMQLPISEVRKRLPGLVRRAQRGGLVEITVHGEVVARLLGPERSVGSAADALLAAMKGLGPARAGRPKRSVSGHKSEYLTRKTR